MVWLVVFAISVSASVALMVAAALMQQHADADLS